MSSYHYRRLLQYHSHCNCTVVSVVADRVHSPTSDDQRMGGLRFPCPPFAYAVIASSFFVARYGVKLMPGYQFRRVRHFGSCDDGFGRSGTIGSRSTPRGTGNTHVQQGACHHSPPDGPTGGRNIVETMPPYRRRLSRGTGTVHAISHLIVGCSRCGTRCQELIPTPLSIRVNVRVM